MSNSKETNVYHKAVKRNITDQRPLPISKKQPSSHNWLAVYWSNKDNRWLVWKDYLTEVLARKQMDKMIRYWPMFVVEKNIFETFYRK